MNSIKYENDALVITLKCSDPAAFHSQLMQSIAQNMTCIFTCSQQNRSNVDIAPIITVLQTILPTERHLEKAFS